MKSKVMKKTEKKVIKKKKKKKKKCDKKKEKKNEPDVGKNLIQSVLLVVFIYRANL